MPTTLTDRQLNRATLARQMLLERSDMGIVEAVEWLLGLQAQQTHDPYIGLWSRLSGFTHEALTALIVDRTLARATTMRGTLHLHTADDLIGIREQMQPFLRTVWLSNFKKRSGNVDEAAVLKLARKLLDAEPIDRRRIGQEAQGEIPDRRAAIADHAAAIDRHADPDPAHPDLGLGPRARPDPGAELAARALRAADRPRNPGSPLSRRLWPGQRRRYADLVAPYQARRSVRSPPPGARHLHRPRWSRVVRPARRAAADADTPAPVRFLPLYENAYLGFDNRRRMLAELDAIRLSLFTDFKPSVLIDGVIAAGWTIEKKKGHATLSVEPYHKLRKADVAELEREGDRFVRFMEDKAETYAVEVTAVRSWCTQHLPRQRLRPRPGRPLSASSTLLSTCCSVNGLGITS